ncbi:MAG: hypothetical protein BJ554DRAFT_5757 [Olpidium bornovanus]|uniref:Uncharacterized protein n=1 Tax=Olpidium bornovanus TaxID=278681 RepID=A0A8H7ZZ29_9FUNG|nr:MAG: hypothetical protein BJ554DRAFT_5757 [Olpidium bornovanus]
MYCTFWNLPIAHGLLSRQVNNPRDVPRRNEVKNKFPLANFDRRFPVAAISLSHTRFFFFFFFPPDGRTGKGAPRPRLSRPRRPSRGGHAPEAQRVRTETESELFLGGRARRPARRGWERRRLQPGSGRWPVPSPTAEGQADHQAGQGPGQVQPGCDVRDRHGNGWCRLLLSFCFSAFVGEPRPCVRLTAAGRQRRSARVVPIQNGAQSPPPPVCFLHLLPPFP